MLKLFTARSIITMNPSQPRAEAIAVDGARILEVGSLDAARAAFGGRNFEHVRTFDQDVIVPGLIDPHLHPAMAAVILPMEFITALPWRFPWGDVPATEDAQTYDARLAELAASYDSEQLLIAWGHHELWHGPISRERINGVNAQQPIVVWNRSFHEVCMNDAALELLDITEESVGNAVQVDLPRGRFYEMGLGYALSKLNPILLAPERFKLGLERLAQSVHFGGQTTIGDMAIGIFDFNTELAAMREVIDTPATPFRTELIPHGVAVRRGRDAEQVAPFVDALPEQNSHRLRFAKRIKFFADGAFFSGLAQLLEPGYRDGHHGEWMMEPPALEAHLRDYWQRGYQIHVHVTGDLGLELVLDILQTLQEERPRFNHGFTLEHFGLSTPEQIQRAATLGARVSANVYYLHELSDIFARLWVGQERAATMARIGSTMRAGITTTLHSDFTMAPAQPLNSMWVAVNRINCVGDRMGPEECLTPEQALAAVTINAATVLGREADIGSLRAGKLADFTVLGDDPLTVDPMTLRDLPIRATVFEGQVHPLA